MRTRTFVIVVAVALVLAGLIAMHRPSGKGLLGALTSLHGH